MIALLLAAALQQAAPDPCNAVARPDAPRPNCPAWRLMRTNQDASGYVDPASLRRTGDSFQVMTRTVLNRPMQGILSFNTPLELNCATRMARPLGYYNYDADGRLLSELPAGEAVPVAPRSAFAALLDEYCPRPGAEGNVQS